MQTRIDVRAVPIPRGVADLAGVHHLFIIWMGEEGKEMFLRGGLGNPKLGPLDEDSMGFKAIHCLWGPYVPGSIDDDPAAKSVTVATGYRLPAGELPEDGRRLPDHHVHGHRLQADGAERQHGRPDPPRGAQQSPEEAGRPDAGLGPPAARAMTSSSLREKVIDFLPLVGER